MGTAFSALAIYIEPLVLAHPQGARVLLVARDAELEPELRELGARSVHVWDAAQADLDVRDGVFDLAIIPDLGLISDAASVVRRLRRLVDGRGAVVAMARANAGTAEEQTPGTFPELGPARVAYAELYDLFALQFESVAMTGVLPFQGIVFAELGGPDDVAVSVDTRLAPAVPPGVFVVVASRELREIDPYAIVQVPAPDRTESSGASFEIAAAFAAMEIKAELLAAQLEDAQSTHARTSQTRAVELELVLLAAQETVAALEQRLTSHDEQLLLRDDEVAAMLGGLTERAEHAEQGSARHARDLGEIADAHAGEMVGVELQLRERSQLIASLENELSRREQMIHELVAELEEARAGGRGMTFQTTPSGDPEELDRLKRKIDELLLEVARRDGELVAQEWLAKEQPSAAPSERGAGADPAGGDDARAELDRMRDELDALRQALAQEHTARVAAEAELPPSPPSLHPPHSKESAET